MDKRKGKGRGRERKEGEKKEGETWRDLGKGKKWKERPLPRSQRNSPLPGLMFHTPWGIKQVLPKISASSVSSPVKVKS